MDMTETSFKWWKWINLRNELAFDGGNTDDDDDDDDDEQAGDALGKTCLYFPMREFVKIVLTASIECDMSFLKDAYHGC